MSKLGLEPKKQGFTLLEVMASGILFLIILVSATSLYLSVSALQKASFAGQKIYTESRLLLDVLSNSIQSGFINYQTDDPGTPTVEEEYPDSSREDKLWLKVEEGGDIKLLRYWRSEVEGRGVLKYEVSGEPGIILSSPSINVTRLDFYIKPLYTEYVNPAIEEVPSVTIVWQAQEGGDVSDPMQVDLQTTVSLRSYE